MGISNKAPLELGTERVCCGLHLEYRDILLTHRPVSVSAVPPCCGSAAAPSPAASPSERRSPAGPGRTAGREQAGTRYHHPQPKRAMTALELRRSPI